MVSTLGLCLYPAQDFGNLSNCGFILKVGQEIEVRPGMVSKDQEGKLTCKPIKSKIVSLFAEQNDLQFAVPGGLIGKSCSQVGTLYSI